MRNACGIGSQISEIDLNQEFPAKRKYFQQRVDLK